MTRLLPALRVAYFFVQRGILAPGIVVLFASALESHAVDDLTPPSLTNVSIAPTSTNTSGGLAYFAPCYTASDNLSGVETVSLKLAGSTLAYSKPLTFPPLTFSPLLACKPVTILSNVGCVASGNPISCCTGTGTGYCQQIESCGVPTTGSCRRALDCPSEDNCSGGGGLFADTLVCDGSQWLVRTLAAYPQTVCHDRVQMLPQYAPGGSYSVTFEAIDKVGNSSSPVSAGTVTNTP